MKKYLKAVSSYQWTDKPEAGRHFAFFGLILILAFAYFKIRASGSRAPRVIPLVKGQVSENPDFRAYAPKNVGGQLQQVGGVRRNDAFGLRQSTDTRDSGASSAGSRVLDRPLFDGQPVTVKAVLRQEVNSAQGETGVEARVIAITEVDSSAASDSGRLTGAVLYGRASFNLDTKRVLLQFTELLTRDGKRTPINAVAFDPETKSLGVRGDYSSGIAPRVVGAALGQVITTASQLGTARVLQNSGDDVVTRELNRTATDQSGRAAGELSQEATKDLRNTKAELSLSSESIIFLKLKAATGNGGGA